MAPAGETCADSKLLRQVSLLLILLSTKPAAILYMNIKYITRLPLLSFPNKTNARSNSRYRAESYNLNTLALLNHNPNDWNPTD